MNFNSKIIDGDNYHLNLLVKSKKIKKIFLISGEKSFTKSGAKNYFQSILKIKMYLTFLKK